MAITLIDGVYATVAAGTGDQNVTITGAQAGDVVHWFLCSGQATPGAPTGYTEIKENAARLFRKVLSGADSAVVVPKNASYEMPGYAAVWRGVDNTTPEDATPTQTSTLDPASITTVTNLAAVAAYVWTYGSIGLTGGPSGYSNFETGQIGNFTEEAGFAWTTKASAGAEDPGAFTTSGGPSLLRTFTVALRPAASAGLAIPVAVSQYRHRRM